MYRRNAVTRTLIAAVGVAVAVPFCGAHAQDKIRIGYSISKTGPYAGGASITTLPNYQVWVKDVNDAGGIMLKSTGKKAMIEIVEYDDRSNSEEMIKAIERLASQDKVDLILPPWGTGLNLAAAPVLNRLGYPHLAVTANTERAPELTKRWPNLTFWLGLPSQMSNSLVDLLAKLRKDGKIGTGVAMASVADQFGIELSTAARDGLKKAGFTLTYDKSYPLGTQDMQSVLKDAMADKPDTFIAFSYPPDTFAVTDTAKVLGFNPKVFFVGVGAAFPSYNGKFAASAEGVMGAGGSDPTLPGIKAFVERHKAMHSREPDRWASPITYASLQVLQQAIEKVGKIDRAAIIEEIRQGTFETIIGKVKLKDGMLQEIWGVGQWQGGEFYGVAPTAMPGARAAVVPKPVWK